MPASNRDYYSRTQRHSRQATQPQTQQNPYFQRYGGNDLLQSTPYHEIGNNYESGLRPVSSRLSDTTHTYVDLNTDDSSVEGFHRQQRPRVQKPRRKKAAPLAMEPHNESYHQVLQIQLAPQEHIIKREKRLFSFLYGKDVPEVPLPHERQPYPWLNASYASQAVFFWIWPMLRRGYKRTLVPDDLWYLPKQLTVEDMHARYRGHLERLLRNHRLKLVQRAHKNGDHVDPEEYKEWPMYAIPWALFLTFRWSYSLLCFFLACSFGCQACAPLITKRLIEYVEYLYYGVETTYTTGIVFSIVAVVLIFINGVLLNHFFHNAMVTGAAAKSILTKDVLLKSFMLSAKLKHRFSTGRINSLMATDLLRIDLAIGFQPLVLCFPIPVAIAIGLLLNNIGVTSLAGIGLFVLSLVICVLLTSKLFFTRETVVKFTDERISLMREVLNNLKIIKFYAWEYAYKKNITAVREREMRYLFTIDVLRNFITAYAVTLPTLTSMVSFVTMWASDNMKSPSEVFSSLSLFSILAQAIMLLPIALSTGADATIGFRRCKDYLGAEEYNEAMEQKLAISDSASYTSSENFEFTKDSISTTSEEKYRLSVAIQVSHADFVWEQFVDASDEKNSLWADVDKKIKKNEKNERMDSHTGATPRTNYIQDSSSELEVSNEVKESRLFRGLFDINLTVNTGEFVVITGVIGSGKSSLLNALAGFMKLTNPQTASLQINTDVLLCGAPWIQNATVRDNILFGKPMVQEKYDQILSACCLEDDIKQLSHGDMTEIGEKGVTLSGGQKARISLARAVYNNASTLLFDDVLSAVDSRVGKHIITNLFEGLLLRHTRILATHQLSLVASADKIVFLNGDGNIDVGNLNELLERNAGFKKLFKYSDEASKVNESDDAQSANYSDDNICLLPGTNAGHYSPILESPEDAEQLNRKQSIVQETGLGLFGKTIEDEDVSVNAISWNVYKKYISMGLGILGVFAGPIFLFFVALSTFCQLFTNTWLSFWMEKKYDFLSDKFYVTFYVIFACLTVVFTGIQFTILAYINNTSAKLLNVKAVAKILHVPMSFMDTNPLGRVLNRFTKDTDSLDNALGEQLKLFIFPLATIIGVIILCIIYLPWFAIAVPFLVCAFMFFASLYSASTREIKRLEAVQRSVVYNNFNETLNGMSTIKAFKAEGRFVERNDYLLNRMNEAYFLSIATQRWLCVHLDTIAAVFALIISLLCVTNQFNISASSTGLLLNYVIQIVGLLSLTIRAMTQVENEMNSVERLHSYAFSLPQEAAYNKPKSRPPREWPMAGYIQFNNVSLRYRPNLPLVLKDLNFGVYPGEKLGICGRTGAGKSSIMTGIYRLNELDSGSITIDGLDISEMGLRDLRSKLLIIPQDPVLFCGTIRKNLDPFSQYNDDILWDSLRRSGLIDEEVLLKVRATRLVDNNYDSLHKFHLDQVVEEDGSNFSLGEKQLIALARSLVRNSKILILDEATSSVDYETDAKIQDTIVKEFARSTILCIAHRLRTILNYDRILVMDHGKVVEKGTPWTLYRQNGLFKNMCDKAHITADDFKKPQV